MDRNDFYQCLAAPNARGYDLNNEQKAAVDFGTGPLWLLAGPGSGKSEVLVTRTLWLLCNPNPVPSNSIFLTTFTIKAARNLEDRLSAYLIALQAADPGLASVDLSDLRIGTLHSLCNDVLREYRYAPYQNVRLLDDVEQHLFIYRYADVADYADRDFWNHFDHAVPEWSSSANELPSKWKKVKAAATLFNRIVEDRIDVAQMSAAGGVCMALADLYEQYVEALSRYHRCDFAHLQQRFLEFLTSPAGRVFLDGDESRPPISHVLVDEYQDTNPIQEQIYLALAARDPHNLVVVGDDDQALYRFRGGTVSCMVSFDQACLASFGCAPHSIPLYKNYRSHEDIVDFFNHYIVSFPEMGIAGVRAPGKQPVSAERQIPGTYSPVAWIARRAPRDLPRAVADLVQNHLMGDGIVSDWSQCVVLLRSAKDSPRNAGPFLREFEARGIPVYNPRSKSFMESQEVQCLLMALVEVIDENHTFRFLRNLNGQTPQWVTTILRWVAALDAVRNDPNVKTDELDDYLNQSSQHLPSICATHPGAFLDLALPEILYRILSLQPFKTWRDDPARNLRLAKVTRLFESYHSFNLDNLRTNPAGSDLDDGFRRQFYHTFLRYLIESGIDEDEDEDVIVPEGYLPIMTIHQSKGLEFPFVIVAQLGNDTRMGSAQILEREMAPFRQNLYVRAVRDPVDLAVEDDIRLFYVAYSRAEYALILVATPTQVADRVSIPGRDAQALRRNTPMI